MCTFQLIYNNTSIIKTSYYVHDYKQRHSKSTCITMMTNRRQCYQSSPKHYIALKNENSVNIIKLILIAHMIHYFKLCYIKIADLL